MGSALSLSKFHSSKPPFNTPPQFRSSSSPLQIGNRRVWKLKSSRRGDREIGFRVERMKICSGWERRARDARVDFFFFEERPLVLRFRPQERIWKKKMDETIATLVCGDSRIKAAQKWTRRLLKNDDVASAMSPFWISAIFITLCKCISRAVSHPASTGAFQSPNKSMKQFFLGAFFVATRPVPSSFWHYPSQRTRSGLGQTTASKSHHFCFRICLRVHLYLSLPSSLPFDEPK